MTVDILMIVFDRNSRAFNRSEITQAVPLDISKATDMIWHAGLLNKLETYKISGRVFNLTFPNLSNRQAKVVLNGKTS